MNRFCTTCGSATIADARFCPACGNALNPAHPQSVGWTTHHLDPAVQQRAEKNKKNAWIFTIFLTFAFPIGFALAGIFMEDMPIGEALLIGIGLGLMMLIIGIIRISKMKSGTWDGTVTDKKQKRKLDHSQDDSVTREKTIYTIVITESNGRQHRLNYTDNTTMYNYFNIGDRVRCHMAFGTYEKFDKSRDSIIYCNICGTQNDISLNQCKSCRLPLFK